MTFPIPILNRLRLGGSIAAEVPATRDEYRAWVYVRPIVQTPFQKAREQWTRERQYQPVDFAVQGFVVRYIELSAWHLAWDEDDLDLALKERPTIDLQLCVRDEQALEVVVAQWCHDVSTFSLPHLAPEPPTMY